MAENNQNLVFLYGPHPGLLGAALPLPRPMVEVATSLDQQTMTLEEAIEKIKPVSESVGGSLVVVDKYQYIGFRYKKGNAEHFYRLICYR